MTNTFPFEYQLVTKLDISISTNEDDASRGHHVTDLGLRPGDTLSTAPYDSLSQRRETVIMCAIPAMRGPLIGLDLPAISQ
eukprot:1124020-Ditylum_brightwellii.AAC.1